MRPRVRTAVIVVAAVLAAIAAGLLLWLPWNPFESDAGPLDEWVPAGVGAVVRFDAGALRRAPVVRTLWDGAAGRRLEREFGLEEALERVRRIDEELAALPGVGAAAPTVAGDFLAGEVLVAARDGDVLAMARISGRAKAIDLLRRAGGARLAEWGIEFDEGTGSYEIVDGDAAGVRFARRRDVLIASTSDGLFEEALALAAGGGESIAGDRGYRAARPPAPAGARVAVWAAGPTAARVAGEQPLFARVLHAAFEHAVRIDVDATARDSIAVTARFAGDPRALCDVSDVAATAARLGRDAFTSGALPLTAQEVVGALFDSQPPARRRLLDGVLAEKGSSPREVVADVARHLADGVGFAVARLPVTDTLRLDDSDGDVRIPVPATFAVFRLADGDPAALLADLRRHAQALFGADAALAEEPLPGGARLFRATGESALGPEWELVRPAFALTGGQIVFCSNADALVASLRAPDAAAARRSGDASMTLDVPRLHARVLDLRWDAADRATHHDWAAERGAVGHALRLSPGTATPAERRRSEDDEMARRIRERREIEFPAELRRYRESVAWLTAFTRAQCRCVADGTGLRIDATVGVRVP